MTNRQAQIIHPAEMHPKTTAMELAQRGEELPRPKTSHTDKTLVEKMPKRPRVLWLMVVFGIQSLLVSITCYGGEPTESRPIKRLIDQYMREQVMADRFSGSVLIASHGKILFEKAYGLASVEQNVPNTLATRFKIHSLTKQFTALGIMMLVEQGKLNTSDSICKHFPNCPQAWERVTLHHLLTHTSGIPDYTGLWTSSDQATGEASDLQNLSRVLSETKDKPLDSDPGQKWRYSNFGYVLLACLVQKVSGEPYPEFIRQHIFEPLHMANTGSEGLAHVKHDDYEGPAPVRNLASGYNGEAGHLETTISYMYKLMGAGGIYSTVGDIFLYDQALSTHKLLRKETLEKMVSSAVLANEKTKNLYGYGWIVSNYFNRQCLHHSGGTNGFAVEYARFPADEVSIVIMSNFGFSEVENMRKALAAIVFGEQTTAEGVNTARPSDFAAVN